MPNPLIYCLPLLFAGCSMADTAEIPASELPEEVRQLENVLVYPADTSPAHRVSFGEPLRIGEIFLSSRPMAPGMASGLKTAVDGDGNIYIVNYQEKSIAVYHPDGSLKEQIGRDGKGPGEFSGLPVIEIRAGHLFTYDISLRRMQIFSLDPAELVQTVHFDPDRFSGLEGVRSGFMFYIRTMPDNSYLAGVMLNEREDRNYLGYYRVDDEGEVIPGRVVETIEQINHQWTLDNGMVGGIRLPFSRQGLVTVSESGMIYTANTGRLLIKVYHPEEGYQRSIYYPYQNDPLEEQEVMDAFHPNLQERIRDADFPETWPAMEMFLVDDEQRIWIATIVDDKEIYRWWILNVEGRLLGRFDWTRDEDIELVKDGYMYVREADSEQGLERIARYEIVMQPFEAEEIQLGGIDPETGLQQVKRYSIEL